MSSEYSSGVRFRVPVSSVLMAGFLFSPSVLAAPPSSVSSGSSSLADSIDLRPEFEKWGLERRVQGKRGTCSVFAVTGAIEYALTRKRKEGTRLSVEFLNWASNRAVGKMKDGGFFSDIWKGFARYGVCPEQDMPYQESFDPSRSPSQEARRHARELRKVGLRLHWIKPWNPRTGLTEKQLAAIKRVLNRQWPVCGGLR